MRKNIESFCKKKARVPLRNSLHIYFTFSEPPPEVLCKKRCSKKFRKIHRKTPVPESLFQLSCRPVTLLKKRL